MEIRENKIYEGDVYFWFLLRQDPEIKSIFNCQGFGEEERQAHKGGSAEISQ
jgi:hypothetical protein